MQYRVAIAKTMKYGGREGPFAFCFCHVTFRAFCVRVARYFTFRILRFAFRVSHFPFRAEEVRQRDVIIYSLTHVRERNANLEARSRARVVGQGTKRRC